MVEIKYYIQHNYAVIVCSVSTKSQSLKVNF